MNTVRVRNMVLGDGIPKICVPVIAHTYEELVRTLDAVKKTSFDLVEFRADFYFQEEAPALEAVRKAVSEKPVLYTIRTKEEGGEIEISDQDYRKRNLQAARFADLVDLQQIQTIQQLISRTRFVYRLINLPEVSDTLRDKLSAVDSGLWIVDSDNNVHDLGIQSVFLLGPDSKELFARGNTLFVSGAVSNRLLKFLSALPNIKDIVLIVRDFTKLFITPDAYADFTRRGGTLQVLQRSRLIAVSQGYTLNSAEACRQMSEALQCPVYDVVQCGRE